jgi:tetratricopeptide (TPR) repeat protein
MKQPELEPSPLADILQGRLAGPGPAGIPTRLALERQGDAALAQGRFAEALVLYKAAHASSWRLRCKMGWCSWNLEQWEAGARYLADAPRRGEVLPLVALIKCVAALNGRTGERDQELDGLVRVLLLQPDPDPYFYELADLHMIDRSARLEQLRAGYEKFPADAGIRRRYTRAAWGAGVSEEELLHLVHEATSPIDAAPEDLWQGYEILWDCRRYDEASALVQRLVSISPLQDRPYLQLVEADTAMQAGELAAAYALYEALILSLNTDDRDQRELALQAAKGLLQTAVLREQKTDVSYAAASLVAIFCHHGIMAIVEQSSPIDFDVVRFHVGQQRIDYIPYADLRAVREKILAAVSDPAVRAVMKVLYAAHDGPNATLTAEERNDLILSASRDSSVPHIQRHVAWAMMESGAFESAGSAFALFDLARAMQDGAQWIAYDHDSMFDESPYNDEAVVDDFADGMIKTIASEALGREPMVCDHLYDIATVYLRGPLLHYKLHSRFLSMMEMIVAVYRAAKVEPTESTWFDYGLACHYTGNREQALAAYAECLAQHPGHAAARANQLMLVPASARADIIIGHAIDSLAEADAPVSIDEITLKDAVYLLALYRACGGAEHDLVLLPFGTNEQPFAPTPELLVPLFNLLRTGLVRISKQSPSSAFTIEQSPARVTAYVLRDLVWEVPAATLDRIREIEEACLTGRWPDGWRQKAPELAQELAVHECLAYLRFCAEDRGLPMPAGEKAVLMIENALTTYSVGQTYAFCWQGAAAAADFRQRKNVSAQHAGNTIVNNCQRRIDHARLNEWKVSNYTRPREVRRTQLSYTLFDAFLGFGDRAFTVPLAQLFEEAYDGQQQRAAR